MTDDGDKKLKLLRNAVDGLMEHFDAIQVVASSRTVEGTEMFHTGKGNYYARRGMVHEWILREEEGSKVEVRNAD